MLISRESLCNGNWTEWSAIWSEIIRVISKSNERVARVRFEITSMISDQNYTTRSLVATLLDPFWNRTIFGEKQ